MRVSPDLSTLSLKDNTIIVWKTPEPDAGDLMKLAHSFSGDTALKNCFLVALRPDEDLSVLDDEELDRMGLQRKKRARRS